MEVLIFQGRDTILSQFDTFHLVRLMLEKAGSLTWIALIVGVLVWLAGQGVGLRKIGVAALVVCLAVRLFYFIVPGTTFVRPWYPVPARYLVRP